MREFHVTYCFHLKNEDWGSSQRASLMTLSHQSSFLPLTQLFVLFDSVFMIQDVSLSNASRDAWWGHRVPVDIFDIWLNWKLPLFYTNFIIYIQIFYSFLFSFLYTPSTCLLVNCSSLLCKKSYSLTFYLPHNLPSSSSLTRHEARAKIYWWSLFYWDVTHLQYAAGFFHYKNFTEE